MQSRCCKLLSTATYDLAFVGLRWRVWIFAGDSLEALVTVIHGHCPKDYTLEL